MNERFEPREKFGLGRVDLRSRLVDREELGAIDLGEVLPAARSRRPLGFEGVALNAGRIEVALEGPGDDGLAGFLTDFAEWNEFGRR